MSDLQQLRRSARSDSVYVYDGTGAVVEPLEPPDGAPISWAGRLLISVSDDQGRTLAELMQRNPKRFRLLIEQAKRELELMDEEE